MTFDEYQKAATETAQYPNVGQNLVYPAMGLAGEAGEYLDKVKKRWRNTGEMSDDTMKSEEIIEFAKEIGDVLWYAAACANELHLSLTDIADVNLKKLRDRRERGVIKSQGDNR
jgi:NTP pyrophosphatase (non-canonical NTP hydrolase)